jgi:hypothetical protein
MLIDIQFIVPRHSSPGNGSQGSTHKAAQVVDRRCSLAAGYQTFLCPKGDLLIQA